MSRLFWSGLAATAVLVGYGVVSVLAQAPAYTMPALVRTAVPTWTLPFQINTPTLQPTGAPTHAPPTVTAPPPTALQPATVPPTVVPPTQPPPTAAPPSPTPTEPPRLLVPDLDLDQVIVPVLIRDNAWDLDTLQHEIGWLTTTGQQPGGDLAVTLAGHVNLSLGVSGPFVNLGRLKTNAPIIYRLDGVDYLYAVQGQTTVKPEDVAALYVPDGQRLLLVTCSSWSYFWGHYARRLIVAADLVGTQPSP